MSIRYVFLALALLATTSRLESQEGRRISGRVVAAADSTPLASVWIGTLGTPGFTLTDSAGRFTLPAPAGDIRLAFRRIGLIPDTATIPVGTDTVTLFARSLAVRLAEVGVEAVVSPARARFDSIAQPNIVTLSQQDILRVPGLIEPDVLKAVQLLPGTVARNDYSTGYNVRGGESDQNLVLLDGVTVFNPSHFGGIFSTFDVNALDRADFMTGGFPSEYSGRLSSVLDVTVRPGSRQRIHGSGGISLLSSKALLEGPAGPATVLLAARRTYVDQVVKAVSKEVIPYYFTDLIGKIDLPYGKGGHVALTGFWGRDVLSFNVVKPEGDDPGVDLRFDWGNRLAGLNWRHPLGGGTLEQHFSVTEFFTRLDLEPDYVHFDNRARLWSTRTGYALPRFANQEIKIGVAGESFDMRYAITLPATVEGASGEDDQGGGDVEFFNHRYRPRVFSAFAHDQWWVTRSLVIRGGARLEAVPGASFTGISPRGSFKYFVSPDHAITGSAGSYYQVVQSQRDQEIPIALYEFWVGASPLLPVAHSNHLVLGYEGWISGGLQLTVEGYRKTFDHLIAPKPAFTSRDSTDLFVPVTGNAWGADVLLRRHIGTVRGWLAYSYVRATRRTPDLEYPPAHDRRHTINIVLQAPGPMHSELGVRWGFGSPLPYTPLLSPWDHRTYSPTYHSLIGSRSEPLGGVLNSARFPNYSRLDVGLRWHGRKWGLVWEPYVQMVNTYNRRNVFTYFFDDNASRTMTAIYQLPILLTFGADFSW